MGKATKGTWRARLKDVAWLYRLYGDLDLLRKHGSFRPTRAKILGSDNVLFADPREPRGRGLLRDSCASQPEVKAMWRRILERTSPDLVLDVGVNYGEFLFMPTYEKKVRIFGVEAAPSLVPFLQRSREHHPNAEQIELVFAAAGREHGGTLVLHFDAAWSGRSSVLMRNNFEKPTAVEVERISVDGLLGPVLRSVGAHHASAPRPASGGGASEGRPVLVFKIDVESYEEEVLAGMIETLDACDSVGLIEFDPPQLLSLGRSPDAFLQSLLRRFSVWAIQGSGEARAIRARAEMDDPDEAADLVLVGSAELVETLGWGLTAPGVDGGR